MQKASFKKSNMEHGIPQEDEGFDDLMREIDQELAASGLSIPQRPLNAVIAIGKRFRIPIPIAKPPPGLVHECVEYWPVTERVYRWYDDYYGDRTKLDFSPGRIVILIEGDPWILRFPRIFGSVMIAALRTTGTLQKRVQQAPSLCNVVELIEDMPETRIGKLSDASLDYIYDRFLLGFNAFNILEGSAAHEFIQIAHGNIAAAVNYLTHRQPQYGESKWASLQAAEKTLKAAIDLAGERYGHGHDLTVLGRQAQQCGLRGDWNAFFSKLQCSPGIRYGEVPCDRDQAIAAHHASLALIISLYEAGAAFQMSVRLASTAD